MKKDPVRFAPNDRYTVARAEVKKMWPLWDSDMMLSEFVSEQDRITARRFQNMLHALLEEK